MPGKVTIQDIASREGSMTSMPFSFNMVVKISMVTAASGADIE